ncbi:MAG TPA: TIGR04282 family arsenosugar biosynthesis glycosyltransferase [Candidatus Aquicultor sp.]|jgi:hypothetical protein
MKESSERAAIVIMAKRPVPGNVKTRLSPPLTLDDAARLYACFLQDTIDKVNSILHVVRYLALDIVVAGRADENATEPAYKDTAMSIEDEMLNNLGLNTIVLPRSLRIISQGEGSLGDRLQNVGGRLAPSFDKLLFIGADSPDVPAGFVEQAIGKLDASSVVIGPSDDGGYYLIGMRDAPGTANVFKDIHWSTDVVYKQTLARISTAGLSVDIIPAWYDVDEISELHKLAMHLKDAANDAPATAAFLAEYLLSKNF